MTLSTDERTAGLAGRPCKHRAAVALRLWERETGARVVALKRIDPRAVARYARPALPGHGAA